MPRSGASDGDVDASRGNKEVKSACSPTPSPAAPPTPPKKKMLEVKNTAWLHARVSGGRAGVLRPEDRSARLVNY